MKIARKEQTIYQKKMIEKNIYPGYVSKHNSKR